MKRTLSMRDSRPGSLARLMRRLGLKMAWNEPGKDDDKDKKDPWGGSGQEGPPDLDEVVRKMQDKFGSLFGGKKGGGNGSGRSDEPSGIGFYLLVFGVLLVIWLAYEMPYQIKQAERGVVLRFGKYMETINPGLNFRLPRPLEYVYKVDVKKVYNFTDDASMLTQDLNIVDINLFVQYQVSNPEEYLFNIRWTQQDHDALLRSAVEASVRDVVGHSKMDYVMTEGRDTIGSKAKDLMQSILDNYGAGVMVTDVRLKSADPPDEVKDAFAEVNKATEDEERLKNEAQAYKNDILPKARGKAARLVADANAYKAKITDEAKGDASRFQQLLAEYEKAPQVTRDRLYLETIESVLANNRKVMIDVDGGNNLMYLPLDRLINHSADLPSASSALPSGVQGSDVPATSGRYRGNEASGRGGVRR